MRHNGRAWAYAGAGSAADRLSPQTRAVLLQREENEILRQKIKETARRSFAPQAAPSSHFGRNVRRAA